MRNTIRIVPNNITNLSGRFIRFYNLSNTILVCKTEPVIILLRYIPMSQIQTKLEAREFVLSFLHIPCIIIAVISAGANNGSIRDRILVPN